MYVQPNSVCKKISFHAFIPSYRRCTPHLHCLDSPQLQFFHKLGGNNFGKFEWFYRKAKLL